MKKFFQQIKRNFQRTQVQPSIQTTSNLEKNSSISSRGDYPSFCELAAKDSKVFENFRTNPIYTRILEHVSKQLGQRYLDIVLSRNHFNQQQLQQFKANDLYGGGQYMITFLLVKSLPLH